MDHRIRFGLKCGRPVDIFDLEEKDRGLKCGCVCPYCGIPLQAKLGTGKRIRHFAHNNSKCDPLLAYQSALHILAKEILEAHTGIYLPELTIRDRSNSGYLAKSLEMEGKISLTETVVQEGFVQFHDVILENRLGGIIPDVLLKVGETELIVEIAVTHFTDWRKIQKIRKINISAVEINLSHLDHWQVDKTQLEELLIGASDNKKWLFNKKKALREVQLEGRNRKIIRKAEKEREARFAKPKKIEDKKENPWLLLRKAREKVGKDSTYSQGYDYIEKNFPLDSFGDKIIKDQYGYRWARCELCGEIKREGSMLWYKGSTGECKVCCYGDKKIP